MRLQLGDRGILVDACGCVGRAVRGAAVELPDRPGWVVYRPRKGGAQDQVRLGQLENRDEQASLGPLRGVRGGPGVSRRPTGCIFEAASSGSVLPRSRMRSANVRTDSSRLSVLRRGGLSRRATAFFGEPHGAARIRKKRLRAEMAEFDTATAGNKREDVGQVTSARAPDHGHDDIFQARRPRIRGRQIGQGRIEKRDGEPLDARRRRTSERVQHRP